MGVFSKQYDTIVDNVLIECDICPMDFSSGCVFHTDRALWDTGATTTIISSRIVRELKLEAFEQANVSGIGGVNDVNTYLVHISLPTGDTYTYLEVMESDFEDYDVIIGMDIIGTGDFCFTNADGRSLFSFRYPAKEHIILK